MMIYVIYALSVAWSVGCALALVAMFTNADDGERIFIALIGGPIAFLVAAIPWVMIQYAESPTLAELKKGEWACTATRTETSYMPVQSGNSTTMVPTTHSVCIQYNRTI